MSVHSNFRPKTAFTWRSTVSNDHPGRFQGEFSMRGRILVCSLIGALAAGPASAATIVVYTNPMTMERRTVVVDSEGPDRAFMCMLPPGDSGCRAIPFKRARRLPLADRFQ
jgi:hypothetical protein